MFTSQFFFLSTPALLIIFFLGVNLFDNETNPSNVADQQTSMDLIFSSTTTTNSAAATHHKYQKQQPQNQKSSSGEIKVGDGGMVVDGLRGPGREFLRSISSVTTSPVSHLPGGGAEEKLAATSMPKMSKKELKLAQNQLNKLTQINIHLHGKARRHPFRFQRQNFSI